MAKPSVKKMGILTQSFTDMAISCQPSTCLTPPIASRLGFSLTPPNFQ
jgi:hypothetical protein